VPTTLLRRPVVDDATRRRFLGGAAGLAVLAACGAPASPSGGSPVGRDGFPVRIPHRFGTTEVPAQPQRVVTVGFVDHDAVLALGIVPVGVATDADPAAGRPLGLYPWAQDLVGPQAPEVLGYLSTAVEPVAALEPDLVLGLSSGLTEQEYRLMSAVAPTVAQPAQYPDYFMPWPELTVSVGTALGRREQAEQLVAGVREQQARIAAEHPAFAGRSLAYAGVVEGGGFYVESSNSPRVSILSGLGFTVDPEIDALAGGATYAEISAEQLGLLDRDVLVWETAAPEQRAAIESSPLYAGLSVAAQGRALFVDDADVAAALGYPSVLSIPIALDWLTPRLAVAAG